ncbi:hypothetical protein JQK88_26180 [Mesorhizobium caraganae]|uniref:hypothetical protein n=1 Tax=Mesorhizobium caraganae TaxID=483206 RepID=UPI00177DEF70|nr:hypothetical protein [Mesorhizobium caraganae]MBM2714649.1 hypothetical protein [Mesorhizobium caraganae]
MPGSAGDLLIDGVRANDIDPSERGLAMVFQVLRALPHCTARSRSTSRRPLATCFARWPALAALP